MLVIDINAIDLVMLVALTVTVTCSIGSLYTSIQNKTNLQNLTLSMETRLSQLIAATERKANVEGQMQGRDWAVKQVNDAANTASQILITAAETATKLTDKK